MHTDNHATITGTRDTHTGFAWLAACASQPSGGLSLGLGVGVDDAAGDVAKGLL